MQFVSPPADCPLTYKRIEEFKRDLRFKDIARLEQCFLGTERVHSRILPQWIQFHRQDAEVLSGRNDPTKQVQLALALSHLVKAAPAIQQRTRAKPGRHRRRYNYVSRWPTAKIMEQKMDQISRVRPRIEEKEERKNYKKAKTTPIDLTQDQDDDLKPLKDQLHTIIQWIYTYITLYEVDCNGVKYRFHRGAARYRDPPQLPLLESTAETLKYGLVAIRPQQQIPVHNNPLFEGLTQAVFRDPESLSRWQKIELKHIPHSVVLINDSGENKKRIEYNQHGVCVDFHRKWVVVASSEYITLGQLAEACFRIKSHKFSHKYEQYVDVEPVQIGHRHVQARLKFKH